MPGILHHVLCDGGLSNRFNALIFALVLRERFGGDWHISWPINNWCGAAFEELFECSLPVDNLSIEHYKAHESEHVLLMHENQLSFSPEHLLLNRDISDFDGYARQFAKGRSIVYYNNLIPAFVGYEDLARALRMLRPNAEVARRALAFCAEQRISPEVVGLHIRKTDFGASVDDQALFEQARCSTQRYFVCSDDAEVNQRFAALPNCAVFPKSSFPEKVVAQGNWQDWVQEPNGRQFPFNITRPSVAVVEGLVDQLILSRTSIVSTSSSTFLQTARLFGQADFLNSVTAPLAPVTANDLFALLNLIRPWQLSHDTKLRVGGPAAGGYVLPAAVGRCNLLVSLGQAHGQSFEQQLSQQGAQCLHLDHPTAAALQSLAAQIDWRSARQPILKLECGDAGWQLLHTADNAVLEQFEHVVGSFSGLQQLTERAFFDRAMGALSKLSRTHRVVHMHADNADGMIMLGGVPCPRTLELSWLRIRGHAFHAHSGEPIPGPLDRPNNPHLPDLHLRAF